MATIAYIAVHLTGDALDLANLVWAIGVLVIVFGVSLLALRRAAMAFTLAVLLTGTGFWAMAPRASSHRSGDPTILRYADMFSGFRDISAVVVDLNGASTPIQLANLGSSPSSQFEIGSISKALTGMVIADEVRRGEMDLASSVEVYLPALKGSPLGAVSMRDLVTHRSGLAQFAPGTVHRAIWAAPLGRSFMTENADELMAELRSDPLITHGQYVYSSLGAAAAGVAAAAAAGMTYPELMQARLFGPLGMTHTAVQTRPMVAGGRAATGRPIKPWVMDAYAPAGAVVSTSADLATLATAVLNGTAPGLDALKPIAETNHSYTQVGMFWMTNRWDNDLTVSWHSGETAGYSAWLGIDREHQRAVVVLGDDANPVDGLGEMLLSDQPAVS